MRFTILFAGILASILVIGGTAMRADGQQAQPATSAPTTRPASPTDLARPGAVHERLARRVGKYATTIAYKPKAPTGDIVTTGEAVLRMSLDGRFLIDENSGVLLGRGFSGYRMTGYNNATGKYEASWADTNSTGLVRLVGESSDNGKTVVYAAKLETADGTLDFGVTDRQKDEDSFSITITSAGATLDITYQRQK